MVFDPFLQTKLVGKGTGLGLSIATRLLLQNMVVVNYNAFLHLEKEPNFYSDSLQQPSKSLLKAQKSLETARYYSKKLG
jgi:hypothetical protein